MLMEKTLACFFVYMFLTLLVFGQGKQEILWGQPEEKSSYNFDFNFIGKYNNGVFSYRYNANKNNGLILEKYDSDNLKKLFIQNIDLEDSTESKANQNLEKIVLLKNNVFIFSSATNKKEKKNFLFANVVDDAGKIILKNKLICSTTLQEGNKADQVFLELSADSSCFLIAMKKPNEKEKNTFVHYFIIDQDLFPVLNRAMEIPYLAENTQVLRTMLWANQNIYFLLAIEDRTNKKNVSNKIPFPKTYLLLCYNHKLNKLTETEIAIQSKWIHSAEIAINNNVEAAIGGFYSNTADLAISGGYILILNLESGEITSNNIHSINRETLNKIAESDFAVVNKKLTYFELDHFLPLSSNRYILIGESRHISSSANINPYSGVDNVTYTYYNGSIITINFDSANSQLHYIHKDQKTINDYGEFSSYGIHTFQSNIGFIYNKMDINYSRTSIDPYQNPFVTTSGQADLLYTRIDYKSTEIETTDKNTIYESDKNKWKIIPYKSFFVDEKTIYFYAEKGGKFSIAKTEMLLQ
jgi:hypothetical protein